MTSFATPLGALKELRLAEQPDLAERPGFMADFAAYWESLRRGRELPTRSDIVFEDLRPWIGQISLVDVVDRPRRFRWRLVGTRIAERMGRDSTGLWFDEVYRDRILDGYIENYSLTVDRREPVWFSGDLEFVGREFIGFEMVQAPLGGAAGSVAMIVQLLSFPKS